MKAKTVILSNLDVSVFSFTKERKRNLTIRGFVKYAAAFYKALLVLTGANSKQ